MFLWAHAHLASRQLQNVEMFFCHPFAQKPAVCMIKSCVGHGGGQEAWPEASPRRGPKGLFPLCLLSRQLGRTSVCTPRPHPVPLPRLSWTQPGAPLSRGTQSFPSENLFNQFVRSLVFPRKPGDGETKTRGWVLAPPGRSCAAFNKRLSPISHPWNGTVVSQVCLAWFCCRKRVLCKLNGTAQAISRRHHGSRSRSVRSICLPSWGRGTPFWKLKKNIGYFCLHFIDFYIKYIYI